MPNERKARNKNKNKNENKGKANENREQKLHETIFCTYVCERVYAVWIALDKNALAI